MWNSKSNLNILEKQANLEIKRDFSYLNSVGLSPYRNQIEENIENIMECGIYFLGLKDSQHKEIGMVWRWSSLLYLDAICSGVEELKSYGYTSFEIHALNYEEIQRIFQDM